MQAGEFGILGPSTYVIVTVPRHDESAVAVALPPVFAGRVASTPQATDILAGQLIVGARRIVTDIIAKLEVRGTVSLSLTV